MRRILIYAVVYGTVGMCVGVIVALYTAGTETPPKNIVLQNGSATKAASTPQVHSSPSPEVAERSTSLEEK